MPTSFERGPISPERERGTLCVRVDRKKIFKNHSTSELSDALIGSDWKIIPGADLGKMHLYWDGEGEPAIPESLPEIFRDVLLDKVIQYFPSDELEKRIEGDNKLTSEYHKKHPHMPA